MISQNKRYEKSKKIVIAHRGASGYLPEHTLEAKAMAYAMDPDFLEQDLVLSKDDVPIVVHDTKLDDITDVASQFPEKARKDGHFYVIDFTYKELLQLNVFERFDAKTREAVFPDRFPYGKSHFKLHSFQDEIEMIQGLNKSTGNTIGIYPEIKNPGFHQKEGKDISKIVLQILAQYGYKSKTDACILQCFDEGELKRIRNELKSNLFLVQLVGRKVNEKDLDEFKTYADGIGPSLRSIIKDIGKNGDVTYSDLVKNAHDRNLKVHAFTLRADQLGKIPSFEKLLEIVFYGANVDGAFTDFPDKVVNFVNK
jgi:glycerophosphoryl diester phosphodiesterase